MWDLLQHQQAASNNTLLRRLLNDAKTNPTYEVSTTSQVGTPMNNVQTPQGVDNPQFGTSSGVLHGSIPPRGLVLCSRYAGVPTTHLPVVAERKVGRVWQPHSVLRTKRMGRQPSHPVICRTRFQGFQEPKRPTESLLAPRVR